MIAYSLIILGITAGAEENMAARLYAKWQKTYLVENGPDQLFVNTVSQGNAVSLSEGHGYGMLVTVLAAKKNLADEEQFSKLFAYYQAHQISENNALMTWRQIDDGGKMISRADHEDSTDFNSATDGDLDIAYALLEASHLWPESKNDYAAAATKILDSILTYEFNKNSGVLTVGSWATVDSRYFHLVRPSDVVPHYFEAFLAFSGDKRWQRIYDNSLELLTKLSDQRDSGLIPDFAWYTNGVATAAKANTVATEFDGDYAYNACRIPWRLSASDDERSQAILKKMLAFFNTQPIINSGFSLAGKRLEDQQSRSFAAPLLIGVNSLKKNKEYQGLFKDTSYVIKDKLAANDYYADTLTTIAALEITQTEK